jgi:hypothetical protein
MTVRAKFKVLEIRVSEGSVAVLGADGRPEKDEKGYTKHRPAKMATIKLCPVYANGDPNHENTKFWQASPSGSIELGCVNPEASKQFNLGQEFYIDFTPAGPAPLLE